MKMHYNSKADFSKTKSAGEAVKYSVSMGMKPSR